MCAADCRVHFIVFDISAVNSIYFCVFLSLYMHAVCMPIMQIGGGARARHHPVEQTPRRARAHDHRAPIQGAVGCLSLFVQLLLVPEPFSFALKPNAFC